ncbi:putative polyprotein [Gregarina niphandrodes]|uniref:Polyprotein n=1 Tax=Gregarina niphandrodes TaxID=110365 RepID=A0A023B487_GRENI|nr:putative polyprotein [Gregarina niphandrodes]EZG56395.1 putative polyprotein [Gregarina niphandrodes]|eukprot:XP_011131268.1 putative polyprotein [Gregarina niphandrodes]
MAPTFGVKSSPIVFQRIKDQIIARIIGSGVNVYVGDAVIYANDLDVLFERLEQVLDRCCAEGLYLELKRGYLASNSGIKLHTRKVEAIRQVSAPNSIVELTSFLGAATEQPKMPTSLRSIL